MLIRNPVPFDNRKWCGYNGGRRLASQFLCEEIAGDKAMIATLLFLFAALDFIMNIACAA